MSRTAPEIERWMVERVALLMDLPSARIDTRAPLVRQGLDSIGLVALTADLETWLGYRFSKNPLEDYPSIETLANFLAGELAQSRAQ